jgi:hypothetical protein
MEPRKSVPLAGAGTCLLTVAAVGLPYVVATRQGAVAEYYGAGAVSPIALGFVGLISVVAFAAGAYERSDPELVAGIVLVAGVGSLLVVLGWLAALGSVTVDITPPGGPSLGWHPLALLVLAGLWTGLGAWYARTLRLL